MKRDVTFIWFLLRFAGQGVFYAFVAGPAVMVSVWLTGITLFTDLGVRGGGMRFNIQQAQQYQDAPSGVVLRCNLVSERGVEECEWEPLTLPLAAEQDARSLLEGWGILSLLSACLLMLNAWARGIMCRHYGRYVACVVDENRAVVR